jgi:hypothetical protein
MTPRTPSDEEAWHISTGTLRSGDDLPADGVAMTFDGEFVPLQTGLYASRRLLDALPYANGSVVSRVLVGDLLHEWPDKLASRRRTIIWRVDCVDIFRRFARICAARSVHLCHLDAVAQATVDRYLTGGPPADKCREIARLSAYQLDWTSQRDVSWYAAHDALFGASWDGAIDAQGYPPHIAARDVAMHSAFALARAAALNGRDGLQAWENERNAQEEILCSFVAECAKEPRT